MQIIVLGMHRSGTSMIASLIEAMGANIGDHGALMPAKVDNPKGFFERLDVSNINDDILALSGGSWDDIVSIDLSQMSGDARRSIDARIEAVVEELSKRQPWVMKDPRLSVTLDFWTPHLSSPLFVGCLRHPSSVARSLFKRNRIPIHVGLALWEAYQLHMLQVTHGQPLLLLDYDEAVINPSGTLIRLSEWLREHGCAAPVPAPSEIDFLVDPSLRHNRPHTAVHVSPGERQLTLYESLKAETRLDELFLSQAAYSALYTWHGARQQDGIEPHSDAPGSAQQASAPSWGARPLQEASFPEPQELLSTLLERIGEIEKRLVQGEAKAFASHRTLENQIEQSLQSSRQLVSLVARIDSRAEEDQERIVQAHAREKELSAKIALLRSALVEVQADARAIRRSASWRIGSALPGTLRLFGRQRRTALDNIDRACGDALGHEPAAVLEDRSIPTPSAWHLILAAGRHPAKTLRLLTVERVVNFGRTLCSRDSSVKSSVYAHYLDMYQPPVAVSRKTAPAELQEPLRFPGSSDPIASVIVPVYNEWDVTYGCLRSLVDATSGLSVEVVLADDCSTDETINAASYTENLHIVRTASNSGFLRNCNNAASHSRGKYVVFLNNDTLVDSDWLSELLRVVEEDPRVGVVGSMLLFPNGKLQEAGGIIWRDASGWNYGRNQHPDHPSFNYRRETDYVSGASLLVRRELWDAVGGFDERFAPAYYEDTDLCFEARRHGYKVVYQPTSRLVHLEGASHGTDEGQGIKHHQVINCQRFLEKWQDVLAAQHIQNAVNVFSARDRSRTSPTLLIIDHHVPFFDKDAGSRSTFEHIRVLRRMGCNVKFFGDNFYPHQPYTRALEALGVEVLYGPAFQKRWHAWFEEHADHIDVVYMHRPHIASKHIKFIRNRFSGTVWYQVHDLHFMRKRREFEATGDANAKRESEEWHALEAALIEQCDVTLSFSVDEVARLGELFPQRRFVQLPLYVFDEFPAPSADVNCNEVLFVGGFGHPPNVDAAIWLVNEVWPSVCAQVENATLTIVGSNPPTEVSYLTSETVSVVGYVPDEVLHDLYRRAAVNVIPLRYGAGVKGKMVESLALGLPVASTSFGTEGLSELNDLIPAYDDATGLAGEVVRLLQLDSVERRKLALRYVEYARRHFSPEQAASLYASLLGYYPLSDSKDRQRPNCRGR